PMFTGFRREGRLVIAGSIANLAYGSRAYHSFVDIVDDLIASCRTHGTERDTFLARLPKKMQKLRARLSKSSNQAMQRTASQAAIRFVSVCHRPLLCVASHSGLAVADLVSR